MHYDKTWNSLAENALMAPLKRKKPTTYSVNSMGDLFHDDVPDEWIDQVFAVMALCPQHTFKVLTKRSARMQEYISGAGLEFGDASRTSRISRWIEELGCADPNVHADIMDAFGDEDEPRICLNTWPLRNVWLGVSAEDQTRADERIPDLLATPAAVRFVSAEPLLGLIDFCEIAERDEGLHASWVRNSLTGAGGAKSVLDWIIVGGESGPNARPMHPYWARSIRDQCAAAGTAFFFKQWGKWLPLSQDPNGAWDWEEADERNILHHWDIDDDASMPLAKKAAGRLLDGVMHNAMPGAK